MCPQKAFDLGKESELEKFIYILTTQERRRLTDTNRQKISKQPRESLFEGLTLSEYVLAKEAKCRLNHKDCLSCNPMTNAGKVVLKSKVVPLSFVLNSSFDGVPYDCEKAQRRLL